MLKKYELPDDKHPKINAFTILYSKLNSSVKALMLHKKTPDQKPMQSGQ